MKRNGQKYAHTAVGKAVTELILETFRFNGRLLAVGDDMTRDLGLSSARWQVLGAIADGPLPVSYIARNMGLTRQSVQRVADILAEEGIVEFAENLHHQRAKLVKLTKRGEEVYGKITRRQINWSNQLAKGLSVRELNKAVQLMETLRKSLEKD
ncbi:MAG TPA: MarR family transcriptional regulator [Candidatus Methylomirabilis sp.]|nr:MarR family transcriptional regulator [Candidatus Methylomirabilis sp.]